MHMRLLTVDVDREGVDLLRRLYEERIIPALERVKGCRFAGLLQSVSHEERCLSLTLWESPSEAAEYERSGLFRELVDASKVFFSQSVEYSIKLSEDLRVEYVPVTTEPVVHSYPVTARGEAAPKAGGGGQADWLRIVSLKVLPGKLDDFKQIYVAHSIPALRAAPGCRYVYLLENEENRDEVFSITIWESREHAVAYEQSGVFERLIDLQKHLLSGHAQGKFLAGAGEGAKSRGTDDILVEHYTILTGRSFG